MSGFEVGEVVVRVNDPGNWMPVGTYKKVVAVGYWDGRHSVGPCQVLHFSEQHPDPAKHGWVAHNFRKLPRADADFTATIRACRPVKVGEVA